jgi:hypothetical protein
MHGRLPFFERVHQLRGSGDLDEKAIEAARYLRDYFNDESHFRGEAGRAKPRFHTGSASPFPTVREIADLLRVSTAMPWCSGCSGKVLPYVRVSNAIRILAADAEPLRR